MQFFFKMTKLKKSLSLALLTIGVAMASCSDGDDESSKTIEQTAGAQTTQTVFADETTLNNGIKFTAIEAWTATITEVDAFPVSITEYYNVAMSNEQTDWVKDNIYRITYNK